MEKRLDFAHEYPPFGSGIRELAQILSEQAPPSQNSFWAHQGTAVWQTSNDVTAAASKVLEKIDLDPCAALDPSKHFAWKNIALPQNGLTEDWSKYGTNFFINPPFGMSFVKDTICLSAKEYGDLVKEHGEQTGFRRQTILDWANKTVEEGRNMEGIWLSKADISTKAIQVILRNATAVCYPSKRLNYIDANTGQIVKGASFASLLAYFGRFPEDFYKHFKSFGTIQTPFQQHRQLTT